MFQKRKTYEKILVISLITIFLFSATIFPFSTQIFPKGLKGNSNGKKSLLVNSQYTENSENRDSSINTAPIDSDYYRQGDRREQYQMADYYHMHRDWNPNEQLPLNWLGKEYHPILPGTPHAPITIIGDADFAAQALLEAWPGTGTYLDPYRIQNYDIDLAWTEDSCIEIHNTTVYFVIANCRLERTFHTSLYSGVFLKNVTNGLIFNNNCTDNDIGILLDNSHSNVIMDNLCPGNSEGIYLAGGSSFNTLLNNTCYASQYNGIEVISSSNNNELINNTIYDNGHIGIEITRSTANTIFNNTIVNHGLIGIVFFDSPGNTIANNTIINIFKDAIALLDSGACIIANNSLFGGGLNFDPWELQPSHVIQAEVIDNTINGHPLIYWQNQNGGTVPTGAGQVIAANCSDITIRDQVISNASVGIFLFFTNQSTVTNNTVVDHRNTGWINPGAGILITHSEYNIVSENNCTDNSYGIKLYVEAEHNTIVNNTCSFNSVGTVILRAESNTVFNNTCWNNGNGIQVSSNHNTVIQNNCSFNTDTGMYITDSYGTIANNTCNSNTNYGIHIAGSHSLYTNNTCSDNTGHGILLEGTNHTLTENHCFFNTHGISINNANVNTVYNNNCSSNVNGIYLADSVNNLIDNNTCTANTVGIYLGDYSDFNMIFYNDCNGNSYGVFVNIVSDDNEIKWNSLVDNLIYNGMDNGSDTIIDYNYWSDYGGSDGNGDGIGDSWYSIPGTAGNWDRYPLMNHAPLPLYWLQIPTDHLIEYYDSFYYDLNASTYAPAVIMNWWINDTTNFNIESNTGIITSIGILPVGRYPLEANVQDSFGRVLTAVIIITIQDTINPIWDFTPTDQLSEYGEAFSYDLDATDLAGIDHWWINTTTFSIDSAGVISAGFLNIGEYWVEVRAYDPSDNFCTATFKIMVQDTTPPSLSEPIPNFILEFYYDSLNYQIVANDISGIASYWINDTVHFSISIAGTINNEGSLPVGVYGVEVRVYDNHGNPRIEIFTVTVEDTTPPNLGVSSGYSLTVGGSMDYQCDASDPSGIAAWSLSDSTNLFSLDQTGHLTSDPLAAGTYEITITVTDIYDNAASETMTITVSGATPPPIPGFPLEAILIGLLTAIGALFLYKRRIRRR